MAASASGEAARVPTQVHEALACHSWAHVLRIEFPSPAESAQDGNVLCCGGRRASSRFEWCLVSIPSFWRDRWQCSGAQRVPLGDAMCDLSSSVALQKLVPGVTRKEFGAGGLLAESPSRLGCSIRSVTLHFLIAASGAHLGLVGQRRVWPQPLPRGRSNCFRGVERQTNEAWLVLMLEVPHAGHPSCAGPMQRFCLGHSPRACDKPWLGVSQRPCLVV